MGNRRWTPDELALLGTAPDPEIAVRIGRTAAAVLLKRCEVSPDPVCEVCGKTFGGNILRTVCDSRECKSARWRRWNRENYARNRDKMIAAERVRKARKKLAAKELT